MGAAAAVEVQKPVDASDISATRSSGIEFARSEVIRLRKELGQYASSYGIDLLTVDASDLILGENEDEDFARLVDYIAHIRKCLQLNTQISKRESRQGYRKYEETKIRFDDMEDEGENSGCSKERQYSTASED